MAENPSSTKERSNRLPSEVSESAPLLGASGRTLDSSERPPFHEPQGVVQPDGDPSKERRLYTTTLIFILLILTNTFGLLQSSAQVQLFENIYCSQYYTGYPSSATPLNSGSCKIDSIQADVTFLRGWKSFFDFLPAVILTVPYGMLADKYGRKWILVMNLTSMSIRYIWVYLVCSFPAQLPIWTVWLQSLLGLFGGGNIFAVSLMFVILSDVTPTSQTANLFFRVGAVSFLCFLIGFSVAGELMEMSTWLPFSLAVGLHLLTIPTALALPETLRATKAQASELPTATERCLSETDGSPGSTDPNSIASKSNSTSWFGAFVDHLHKSMSTNFAFLKDWRTLFLALSFPIREALNSLDDLYFQYVPKRFGWTIAKTNFIYSFQAAAAIIILLILCPAISSYLLTKKNLPTERKEVLFARVSVLICAIGTLLIAAAPTISTLLLAILVQTCGAGMGGATRALMTSYVESNEVGRLYSLLGLVEAVGLMLSAPIEAALFDVGLHQGGKVWLGLPWFLMGICLVLLTVAFWSLRLAK